VKPDDIRDLGSTIAGGGAGLWFLSTVNWSAIPAGECVRAGIGVLLIVLGYFWYRNQPVKPA
jgi:hypothetical protein